MVLQTSKQILQTVFEYDNYRQFLRDYFEAKKSEQSSFSQRYFALKSGMKAHNFCTLVINGQRNLSIDSIHKILKGLGLKGKAAVYFENLVLLNQADSAIEQEHFAKKVHMAGKKTHISQLKKDQFRFYETWYYPVVRELAVMSHWNNDYAYLASMVRPAIAPAEAQDCVNMLLKTGMIKKDRDIYILSDNLVTSEDVPPAIKKKSRREVLLKGIDTIDIAAPGEKYAAYSTVTMSKKLYEDVREILDETRGQILSLLADDTVGEDVYEIVFQVFPVSNIPDNAKKTVGGNNE